MRYAVRAVLTSLVALTGLLVLAGAHVDAQAGSDALAALAATRAGQLLGLERNGTVLELDPATGKATRQWYKPGAGYVGIDIAATINRAGTVFVVALLFQPDTGRTWAVTVRADGRTDWNSLSQHGVYGGVAIDLSSAVAYLTNATTNEVFRASLGKETAERFVTDIPSVNRLGPLAYDEQSRRLLIGDSGGAIYSLDVRTDRLTSRTRCGDGDIRALGLDVERRTIYAVDAGDERVYRVPLEAAKLGSCRSSFSSAQFREPSGIGVLPSGHLWISDARTRKLFRFQPQGAGDPVVQDWVAPTLRR